MAKIFATKALSIVLCFVMLFMGAPVTYGNKSNLFKPHNAFYNKKLARSDTDLSQSDAAWGYKHVMIGTVSDPDWFDSIYSVTITDEAGSVLVDSEWCGWDAFIADANYSKDIAATDLVAAGFLGNGLLPVVLLVDAPVLGTPVINYLRLGKNTITFKLNNFDTVTTSIYVSKNKTFNNATSASEVRTLSTDVTISVGGVAKNQKIMVRDINNILSDDTQLHVEVASEAHDELDVPIFDVEHGFHYNVTLRDSAGKDLEMPLSAQVELLFECVEGLDIGQLEIVLAESLTDTQFEEDYQTYGDVQYVGVLTNHFSPYSLLDIQTEDEKAALGKGKNNVKTGDQAVQVAVAGLGSILVLALGIMLRLITSKKKFEE